MQIGPRIRVGGTAGKIGQAVKTGVGKVAQKAAPVVSFFNPMLGAAVGAAGDALDTTDGAFDFGKAAKGAITNYGIGKAGQAVKGALSSAGGAGGLLSSAKKLATGGAGQVVSKLTGGAGGDRSGVVDKLLLGAGIAASAADQKRQRDMQNKAANYATGSYDARAGLRDKGLAMALNNHKEDLSGVFSDAGNPYDVQKRKPVAAPAVASAPPGRIGLTRMPTLGTQVPLRRL